MPELFRTLLTFGLAAILAFALCRAVMALRIMDAPTEVRKTQSVPVPSAGGLGVGLSLFIVLILVAAVFGGPLASTTLAISAGAIACLALGLADDVLRIDARWRLGLLALIAIGMTFAGVRVEVFEVWPGAALSLPLILAVAGSALWLVVVINAVNFMDGANGLSMGIAAVAAVGLAAATALLGLWGVATMAAALAGALAGFLVWNVQGRLFVGDTGALFTGAVLGGLSLDLVRQRPDLLFVPPILLMPYLSDVLLTLIWRARHRKRLFEAHRDHVYQIALKAGLRHWQVSAVHAFLALNAAVVAVIAAVVGGPVPPLAFLALLVISAWLHIWLRRLGVKAGLVGADIA